MGDEALAKSMVLLLLPSLFLCILALVSIQYFSEFAIYFIAAFLLYFFIGLTFLGSKVGGSGGGRKEYRGKRKIINYYNKEGRYIGYSESRGARTEYYDREGKYIGYSEREGGRIVYYDRDGKYIGESESN